jgi:hypothetical protein
VVALSYTRQFLFEMSDHGCIHLNNFKAAKGIQPYRIIHAYFVACTTAEARSRKVCVALELGRLTFIVDIWAVECSETNIINRSVMFI